MAAMEVIRKYSGENGSNKKWIDQCRKHNSVSENREEHRT